MAGVDTSKRLRDAVIQDDVKALQGAKGFKDYIALRPEAKISTLCDLEEKMRLAQEAEIQAKALYRSASDAAQKLEWEFHNAVLSMKKSALAQYGADANEIEAIGYIRKSDRKRPQRQTATAATSRKS